MARWKVILLVGIGLQLAAAASLGSYWLMLLHWEAVSSRQLLQPEPGGALVICGGGAVPEEACDAFLQLAGGRQARLVVIPSYPPTPQQAAALVAFWRDRGAATVGLLNASSRTESNAPDFIKPLTAATGVWLSGGVQSHLAELYVDTAVERQLKALLERKGVIGGCSAGAAAMSRIMITNGSDTAEEERGFDLLPEAVVDQHFFRRNRVQRLLGILTAHPGLVGLGIDEHAAVLVQRKGMSWTVIGQSYAMVCLPEDGKSPRLEILKPGDQTDIRRLRKMPGAHAIISPVDLDTLLSGELRR